MSLNNQETVLKKAITLTPHHEAENYNDGYLTTPNGNNHIKYQIQVNSENNQNQFELSVNNKTWVDQLDTFNLDHRSFLQQVNPSLAVALETQKALTALANDDNIKTVLIRRQKNQNNDAISVYSKDETTTELTVLVPSSQTDSSLQSILSPSQEIRIEKTYINDSLGYKLSFSNYDADAKPIKITQVIDPTGKIQVQTTEEHPVKVFSDAGIITHHRDRVSSETIEIEYKDYLEDATFTYHASGQLIISNLIKGMKVEHYVKPKIQNILSGTDESFIILKPEDKIAFLGYQENKLEKFLTQLLSPANIQKVQNTLSEESLNDSPPIPLSFRGKYGYVKNGKVVIWFKFDSANNFSEGLALVSQNGKYGHVNENGIAIPCQFNCDVYHSNFSKGLALVNRNGKYGYLNTKGEIAIPYQFDHADQFSEDLASVKLDDKYGFIDKRGEIVIAYQFQNTGSFYNSIARVKKNGLYGFIDKRGKIIIDFKFNNAYDFWSKSIVCVLTNDGWGFTDRCGDIIRICYYKEVMMHTKDGMFRVGNRDKYANSKYGLVNNEGQEIVSCKFDDAEFFSEGFAAVKRDKKWGFINTLGDIAIPL